MKLEQNHLAIYLPFSLPIESKGEVQIMTGLNSGVVMINHNIKGWKEIEEVKPVLKPFSHLIKDENVFNEIYRHCHSIDENIDFLAEFNGNIIKSSLSFRAVMILTKYKYDIYGLIKEGIAKDFNDVFPF